MIYEFGAGGRKKSGPPGPDIPNPTCAKFPSALTHSSSTVKKVQISAPPAISITVVMYLYALTIVFTCYVYAQGIERGAKRVVESIRSLAGTNKYPTAVVVSRRLKKFEDILVSRDPEVRRNFTMDMFEKVNTTVES